jgi:hypothetical protein
MRFIALVVVCAVLTMSAGKPAEDIAWGEVDHGVRFGLAFGPVSPEPQLRLIFENVDRPECLLPLGSTSAKGPVYDVEFAATSPSRSEVPVFNFNGPAGIQGGAQPLILEIPKGQRREVVLSLTKLLYLENGQNHPVTDLLAKNYSVRARVDTTGEARYTRTRDQWMGRLSSGDLRRH